MTGMAFAGIDVAIAKGKRLPICLAQWQEGRLEPLEIRAEALPKPPRGNGNRESLKPDVVEAFTKEVVAVLDSLATAIGVSVQCIAIDAPSAPCADGLERRRAECAMDKLGYSCIPTPTAAGFTEIRANCKAHLERGGALSRLPHANQVWMLVGFALFRALRSSRTVIEVYPHAIIRSLGVLSQHKSTPTGYADQLAAAARVTGWSNPADLHEALRRRTYGAKHDRLDAFLSAWVAALPFAELTACGEGPDDVIWIPKGRQ